MTNQRRRFIIVGGIVVVVVILMLAFFGAGNIVRAMSVAEAAAPEAHGQNVEVTGNVVNNSSTIEGDVLTFAISDPDDPSVDLWVRYDKGVAATFGNGVTAICTGKLDASGVLQCDELVTKCPSKYETATDALSVDKLLGYGASIAGKPVKVTGTVAAGSLRPASQDGARFLLADASDPAVTVPIDFDGALSSDVKDGSVLVVSGSLDANGVLVASNVALKG